MPPLQTSSVQESPSLHCASEVHAEGSPQSFGQLQGFSHSSSHFPLPHLAQTKTSLIIPHMPLAGSHVATVSESSPSQQTGLSGNIPEPISPSPTHSSHPSSMSPSQSLSMPSQISGPGSQIPSRHLRYSGVFSHPH